MRDSRTSAIAARLKKLREAHGKSQTEFCKLIGLEKAAWNNYETGDRRISVDAAIVVCEATGASLDWIYRGIRAGIALQLAEKLEHHEPPQKV